MKNARIKFQDIPCFSEPIRAYTDRVEGNIYEVLHEAGIECRVACCPRCEANSTVSYSFGNQVITIMKVYGTYNPFFIILGGYVIIFSTYAIIFGV